MIFEDLYDKVLDLDMNGSCNSLNVVVEDAEGRLVIVNNITIETSVDGVGKYVLLHTVRS